MVLPWWNRDLDAGKMGQPVKSVDAAAPPDTAPQPGTAVKPTVAETSAGRWERCLIPLILLAVGFLLGRYTKPPSAPPGQPQPVTAPTPAAVATTKSATKDDQQESTTTSEVSMEDVLRLARESLTRLETEIDDYTATLVKQERIGSQLRPAEEVELKLQTARWVDGKLKRPKRVYLRFVSPQSLAGQEVIWDQAAADGKMVAHGAGILNVMRVRLEPEGFLAMRGNRYPVTQIGLTNLVRKLIQRGERDLEGDNVVVTMSTGHQEGQTPCTLIQVRRLMPTDGPDDFSLAEISFDQQRLIPLRYTAFGWSSEGGEDTLPMIESYTYTNVELNVGLTDSDFDPDNLDYQFP